MLKLIKTEIAPLTEERLIRMMIEVKHLQKLSPPEQRAAYVTIEAIRDELSKILDRMDGK